jgi:hypothetical protein
MSNAYKIPSKEALELLKEVYPKNELHTKSNPLIVGDKKYVSIEVAEDLYNALSEIMKSGFRSAVYGLPAVSAMNQFKGVK